MKKIILVLTLLTLPLFFAEGATWKLLFDKTVRLTASIDSATYVSDEIIKMDVDSLAFVMSYTADSTLAGAANANDSVGVVVKLQQMTPDLEGSYAIGWTNYTEVLNHAYNDTDLTQFGTKVATAIQYYRARVHMVVLSKMAATQNIHVKVWVISNK